MQQMYTDKDLRTAAQQWHHPYPYTPLENIVTDPMKIYPFGAQSPATRNICLYGDSIHHFSNKHI